MKEGAFRRLAALSFALAMTVLMVWLVSLDRARFYFCAAVIAVLTACLALVRPRRHWLYGIGVLTCLATLILALLPADLSRGGGSYCGSLLHPHDRNTDVLRALLAEDGFDPSTYLQGCEDRKATNVRLVAIGGVVTLLAVGAAIAPSLWRRPRRGLL